MKWEPCVSEVKMNIKHQLYLHYSSGKMVLPEALKASKQQRQDKLQAPQVNFVLLKQMGKVSFQKLTVIFQCVLMHHC